MSPQVLQGTGKHVEALRQCFQTWLHISISWGVFKHLMAWLPPRPIQYKSLGLEPRLQ